MQTQLNQNNKLESSRRSMLPMATLLSIAALFSLITPPAVAAAPQTLADCLKGWDLPWKLPYFPSFSWRPPCETTETPALRTTIVKLSMDFGWEPFSEHFKHNELSEARQAAAYLHFNNLFQRAGFRRNGEALPPRHGYQSVAAEYEKSMADGNVRIAFTLDQAVTIQLQKNRIGTASVTTGAVDLPKPADIGNFFQPEIAGKLFQLPNAKQSNAGFGGFQNLVWQYPTQEKSDWIPALWPNESRMASIAISRTFEYEFPAKVTVEEVTEQYRQSLPRAGWKLAVSSNPGQLEGQAQVGQRNIDFRLWVLQDGPVKARVDIQDPWFAHRYNLTWGNLANGERLYAFTPTRNAQGWTLDTLAQIESILSANQGMHDTASRRGIYLAPALPKDKLSDQSALRQAQDQTRLLAEEFKKRGVTDKGLWLGEAPLAPRQINNPYFLTGTMVGLFYCRTLTEDRPTGRIKTCACEARQDVVLETKPGACK